MNAPLCIKCHKAIILVIKELPSGDNFCATNVEFCPYCGTAQQSGQEDAMPVCGNCGLKLQHVDAVYCSFCGAHR